MASNTMTQETERERYASIVADKELSAGEAAVALVKEYARERPDVVAMWCFGIGFVLGWKLKPW